MHIKKITYQHRRDFRAVFVCGHCNAEQAGLGYDDEHFHKNVIPKMKCPECGLVAGSDYRPLTTKYPAGETV